MARETRIAATGVLLLGCLAWSCAGSGGQASSPPSRAADTPVFGGTLRLEHQLPLTVDPHLTDDAYEATIVNQLFNGLVQWDDNLNVLPDIAQSWIISPDGLDYEFDLRADARFHNGRAVLAEDFVYSFTRLFDRSRVEPSIIQDYLKRIDGVEDYVAGRADHIAGLSAPDSLTLHIRLSEPYPSFLSVLCMDQAKVLPSEEVARLGEEGFGRHPVGTGPFRLAEWIPKDRMVLVANDDYFGAHAYLDSLVFLSYGNDAEDAIRADFLAGKLSGRSVREDEMDGLMEGGDNFFVVRRPELSLEFMGFNCRLKPFDDPRVRKAVLMAIDRDRMVEIAGKEFKTPVGLLPPGMPGFSPESKMAAENLKEARRLLAEAGYGVNRPLRFPVYTASHTDHALARDSVLVACLARVHIEPELRYVDWAELDGRITALTAPSFFITWIADLPDPDSFLYTLFESHGLYNMFNYANPEVDRLLDEGRSELVIPDRLALYRKAESLILDDAPLVPLFNFMTTYVFQPSVRGVEMSPFGLSSIPMEKIWFHENTKREAVYAGL